MQGHIQEVVLCEETLVWIKTELTGPVEAQGLPQDIIHLTAVLTIIAEMLQELIPRATQGQAAGLRFLGHLPIAVLETIGTVLEEVETVTQPVVVQAVLIAGLTEVPAIVQEAPVETHIEVRVEVPVLPAA